MRRIGAGLKTSALDSTPCTFLLQNSGENTAYMCRSLHVSQATTHPLNTPPYPTPPHTYQTFPSTTPHIPSSHHTPSPHTTHPLLTPHHTTPHHTTLPKHTTFYPYTTPDKLLYLFPPSQHTLTSTSLIFFLFSMSTSWPRTGPAEEGLKDGKTVQERRGVREK